MSVETGAGAAVRAVEDEDGIPGRDLAGAVFARLSVVPALLAVAWLVPGLLLLAAGWFRPVPETVLAAVLAVPLLWFGLRAVPASLPSPAAMLLPGTARRTPWWSLAAVAVIAAAFLADQVAFHSQFVIMTRDPGSYFTFGALLAKHPSLPEPSNSAVFGGSHGGVLSWGGFAAYQVGDTVVPQFMAGLPMVLAGADWAGGYHLALLMAPVLGTLALVTFAGLAARLVGPRWAVLATLVVAVSLPMQFTSRSTYSEPLAEILLLGGLALVLDMLRAAGKARALAVLGGLTLGVTVLARFDGVSNALPVLPFCGALCVRRRPEAGWLALGLLAGAAGGVAEGLVFSWPYLMVANRAAVLPMAAVSAVVIAGTAAGTWYWRRRPAPPRWWRWLPNTAPAAAFAVVLAFDLRPHFQYTTGLAPSGKTIPTYAQLSLHWVNWYIGVPLVVAAAAGAGLLARHCLRGRGGHWPLPLMVLVWSALVFLYRPGIVPDQPWASRRLVPDVLPAFVLLGVWAIARGAAWLGEKRAAARLRPVVVAVCALAAVAPAVITDWGLGVSTSHGIRLTADGLAGKRDFQGELIAMTKLCAALPPKAAVIFTWKRDSDASAQLDQDVRVLCGVPTVIVRPMNAARTKQIVLPEARLTAAVKSAVSAVRRHGRTPAVLALSPDALKPYQSSGVIRQVMALHTTIDPLRYFGPPAADFRDLRFELWMWRPSS